MISRIPLGRSVAATATALALVILSGCGGAEETSATSGASESASSDASPSTAEADYPDVLGAELTSEGDGLYTANVTMSSEYDTPERYADGWRVLGPEGEELGTMELGHDHAAEQPFTRTQSGVQIPDDVSEVTVEGHDLDNGYGGATVTVSVPGA